MLTGDCALDAVVTSPSFDPTDSSAISTVRATDLADYETWSMSYGSTTGLAADFNNDGRVDAADYTLLRDAGAQEAEDPASSIRGQAYTELIAVTVNPATGSVTTEVWGTQGTETSPEAAALIDLEAAAQQLGATRVILNGPRYLLDDAGTLTPGEAPIQTFGDLEMQLIGSIELDLASAQTSLDSAPYVPQTVSRNTDSIYYAGSEIYQLTSPAGEMYVMQSTGTEIANADLAGLGNRLTVPEGWVFEVITLEEPLRVTVSDGDTIDVLVGDLGNAYGYVGIDPLRDSEPTEPTSVASLTANPNPAPTGSNITLTATPVVTAAQVVFFRESNGTPGLQNTDTLVGTDTNGADGWTASVNVGTTPSTVTYYAVPVNANGPVGPPMVTTNTVQGGLETAIPNEPADQVYVTVDGVEFVRTPDEQFENLPDWPYEPKYVEIDGLRQAYIDEGPEDGPVVLLLHGQPSWSYLYRDMIPVLVDAGYRVIAMDHLGMGRSDKPTDVDYYTYEVHTDRLEQFIVELGLEDINLFAQDWGSLIGLHVAGENPEWFASIAIGNGTLPVIPAGTQPFPPVLDTDVIVDVPSPFILMPAQQVPFRDADGELIGQGPAGAFGDAYFGNWMNFAMTGASFKPSDVLEALTWFDIPADEQAAYDAPFPSRAYMAGPRSFPSVINDLPGANDQAWAGLGAYDKPFVTIWGGNDPGNLGGSEVQQQLIDHVPGADGQPHTRLPEASHFLQDDQGEEIATQLVAFYQANGIEGVEIVEQDQTRYIDSIFETTISEDIVYATVDGQELLLNVITPQGDTETDRPLIIIANGGAFAFTDREQIIPVAEQFAEAGYVAVVMSYRTQGGPTSGEDFRYAAVDATHDMIAAVRFMKANAETFGIDPNKVIVGGASAGAVMAASVGTTDPDDPISDDLAAYLETVGGVYGNVGEHLDQSPAVQGVFAISGAIFGLDTIDANSAPIYAVHNELDPVAPCGSSGGSGSGISASGTCDFIPAFQEAGVPAQSFIVPGDTGHVQFSEEEWQQFTAEALEFFFIHVVNESGEDGPGADAENLSAYLGAVDVRLPHLLENVSGSDQQRGDEGMPVVFSVQIDAATLDPEDFAVTTASGAVMTPSAVTLSPADEGDERRTVLLTGQLGSADDFPVSVEVVGSLLSVDGAELSGLTTQVTTNDNGPSLVSALVDPGEVGVNGKVTPTRIQTTWQGGVSGRFGMPIGIQQLRGIRIIDVDGEAHVPHGFEDLGDNDNHLVLIVPPGVEPAGVAVRAGTLFDPTNQPNPETAIPISGTIELRPDDNQDSRLRRFFGRPEPTERPLAELPPAVRRVMVSAIADRADLRRLFTDDRARFERDWEDRPMVGRERLRPAIVDAVFGQLRSDEEVETTRKTPSDRGFYRPGNRR